MKRCPHLVPSLVSIVMLVVAVANLESDYYMLLRVVVCSTAVFVGYYAYRRKRLGAIWLFAVIAIIFNPLRPLGLEAETWCWLDFIAAIMFVWAIIYIREPIVADTDGEEARPRKGRGARLLFVATALVIATMMILASGSLESRVINPLQRFISGSPPKPVYVRPATRSRKRFMSNSLPKPPPGFVLDKKPTRTMTLEQFMAAEPDSSE